MTTVVDAPERVDGLQLCGTMVGSGYRTPPALVRRGDGQTLQLTPLLYRILEAVDGRRGHAEIAEVVSQALRRAVPADVVETMVDQHLRPMGLLKLADGSDPGLKRSDPLLGLKFKITATDSRTTQRITDPFRILFRPAIASAVVLGFLAVTWWVFFRHGLAPAAYDAFQRPHLLLLVFVVTVLSGGFHEFGHAAAARYGGAVPGAMGAGVYLVWPAFYTDVTDSYRLDRRGRIRTDLGGLYFNAIVVVLTFVWWYTTGWDALLLLVATQIFQMVQQLLPLLRFDGYHLLADLAGVPDLYHRIRPTLVGMLPHRWSSPENKVLKPGARVIITAWVLVTIPMMALMLLAVVGAVPRLLGTAWAVVSEDAAGVMPAWREGGPLDIASHVLQVFAVVLPFLGCLLILGRVGLRWSRGLAQWSRGSFPRRVAAVLVSTVVVTTLSWAWWPHPDTYRPILPGEQGSLSAILPEAQGSTGVPRPAPGVLPEGATLPAGGAAERRLSTGAPLQATFAAGGPLPTKSEPQLVVVLVPTEESADAEELVLPVPSEDAVVTEETVPTLPVPETMPTEEPVPDIPTDETVPTVPGTDPFPTEGGAGTDVPAEPWAFPFSEPSTPGPGDNQAAAYNTTDGSVTYDVAFALVWATGDEVYNVNEAHAYASCTNCVTVAVAFQVVLIVGDAQVVAPQNLAVAANYECHTCITVALASQLVLSLPEVPTEEQMLALDAVWQQLNVVAQNIQSYTLEEITTQLAEIQAEIVATLEVLPSASPTVTPTASPTASTTPSPSPSTTTTPTESGSPTVPTTSALPSPEATPTSSSSESTTSTDSATPTMEPTTAEPPATTTEPTTSPSPTQETTSSSPSPTQETSSPSP